METIMLKDARRVIATAEKKAEEINCPEGTRQDGRGVHQEHNHLGQ